MPDDWRGQLSARTGFRFTVRPARPFEEAAPGGFFTPVSAEDLRFRFLTSLKTVVHDRLAAMPAIDHRKTENFLAFVDGEAAIVATAVLACDDAKKVGEVAIVIRSDYKAKGISWDLLAHVAAYAEAKGLTTLQ